MREVRILAIALVVLLVGAYASWGRDPTKAGDEKVTILGASKGDLQRIALMTRTTTVVLSKKEGGYWWFDVETASGKRGFVAGDTVDGMLGTFAPLMGLRSLGSGLNEKELAAAELEKPSRKLIIKLADGEHRYDVGGRTYGPRDHYVRPAGGKEVFLVESRVLGDLELPEGRFMQRKMLKADKKDVSSATLKAGERTKKMLHKNPLSEKDQFWAEEASPDSRSETIENYLHKVETLSANRYPPEAELPKDLQPVLDLTWFDGAKPVDHIELLRAGTGKDTKYFARSDATHGVVEVSTSVGEELERDLSVVLEK